MEHNHSQEPDPVDDACPKELFGHAVKLINNLTPNELYQLSARIDVLIEDPARLKPISRSIDPGSVIEYFCRRENRFVSASVDKVNRSTVDVTNLEDGKRWRIELAAVNTGGSQGQAKPAKPQGSNSQLSRHDLSVGQVVGFQDRDNQERFGTIIRLNPKTVTLECEFGTKWRVGYSLLFFVVDSQPADRDFNRDFPRQQLLIN
jgi:hypothetical protein